MEDYIDSKKACKIMGVTLPTLYKRMDNEGLKYYGKRGKGNNLKFLESDILVFMEGRK